MSQEGAAADLTEKSEKRGLWRQVWGLARDEQQLPIAPLVASLIGMVRVYKRHT